VHGKSTRIFHDHKTLFRGLPDPFEGGRYHSLAVEESSLPDCLEVSARAEDGEIMGLRHRKLAIEGVQFHPESILTPQGDLLISNFLSWVSSYAKTKAMSC
jgi:anthranilate synthase/aminodeoxychorismate synthase-like glutamine amidotransferase